MTEKKQTKAKTNAKKNRATLIPLAMGVGVGALAGVSIPFQDGDTHIMKVHANESVPVSSLPKAGANLLTEMGDVTHYNLVTDASSVRYHNGLKWVYATLPGTVFDVKKYNGKLYATASGKYDGKVLRYNEETRVWDTVGTTPEPIYDLIITKDGKFVSGGGASGTYGTDFGIYSSIDGDSNWATRASGYKSNSGGYTGNLGIFYTGVAVNEQTLMFGVSGNWTFIHGSENGKDYSFKQEIYGGYTDAVHADGKVVAVGYQASTYDAYGSIATANAGGPFTVQKMGRLETFSGVTHGNGTFVAVGQGSNNEGVIHSSTDGVNWTKALLPSTTKALNAVDYDQKNKRFVAVGRNGTMLVSLDAKEWVSVNTGLTESITNIEFSENPLTAYDYAVDAFESLSKAVKKIDYKTFTARDKADYEAQLNAIVENELAKVTNPTVQAKLKTQYVTYIQNDLNALEKSSINYAKFLVLKGEVETMPSVTLEDVTAQVNKITDFEKTFSTSDVTAFKNPYVLKQVTFYVEKAETTFLQSDYDFAKNKINTVEYSSRAPLEARLSKLASLLPLKEAEQLVDKAEKTLVYADFVAAKDKSFYLNASPEKTALQKRVAWVSVNIAKDVLKTIQAKPTITYSDTSALNTALGNIQRGDTAINTEYGAIQQEYNVIQTRYYIDGVKDSYSDSGVTTATSIYNNIPATNAGKEALKKDMALIAEMKVNQTATKTIQSGIRSPKYVAGMNAAISAFNALPEGILKDFFGPKLGLVDNTTKEAETLIADLTKNFSPESVTKAEEKIAQVKDEATKAKLTNDLAKLVETEKVRTSEKAVADVEQTPSYDGVQSAREAVSALKDETLKTDMANRLDAVVEELKTAEATIALTELVEAPSEESFDATMNLIDNLKDETVKADMTIQAEKALENHKVSLAKDSLAVAKEAVTREAYTLAKEAVGQLKDGEIKEGLLHDVAEIMETIRTNEAQAVVNAVKETETQTELDKAVQLVNELKDGDAKTAMLSELAVVQETIHVNEAQVLVNLVKETPTQTELDKVLELVKTLKDGETKTAMISDLEGVQETIHINEAQILVLAVKETPTQEAVTHAFDFVNALKDGDAKTAMLSDLDVVQEAIYVNEAKLAVDAVKATPSQLELDKAVELVKALKDSDAKTSLLETIESVQQSLYLSTARELVSEATEEMTQDSVKTAKEALALVKDTGSKAELEAKLQLVQDVLDAKPVKEMLEAFENKLEAITKRPKSSEAQALTNEYNAIAKKVSSLNNGAVKTELTNELKDVKSTLDSVIKNGHQPSKPKITIVTIIHWVLHLIFGR